MDEWVKLTAPNGNPIYVNRSRAISVEKAGTSTYIRFGSYEAGPLVVKDEPEYVVISPSIKPNG